MTSVDNVKDDEVLARALYEPLWDAAKARIVSSAFMQARNSVTRIPMMRQEEVKNLFQHDFKSKNLHGMACVRAGDVRGVVSKEDQTLIEVVPDPILNDPPFMDNPAHASIDGWTKVKEGENPERKSLTRGQAKKIIDCCQTFAY